MTYAKVIEGELYLAPKKLIVDGKQVWNAPAEEYLLQGWKPVTFTPEPEPEEGFEYVSGWKETAKKITQTWTKEAIPDFVSDSEALAELMEVIG